MSASQLILKFMIFFIRIMVGGIKEQKIMFHLKGIEYLYKNMSGKIIIFKRPTYLPQPTLL